MIANNRVHDKIIKRKFKSIIFIDDDPASNYIHKLVIKNLHINIDPQFFLSASEALDYFLSRDNFETNSNFDIIFVDINMPVMDGWSFVKEYQKFCVKQNCKQYLFMLSSILNPDDMDRVNKNKIANDFLLKPLSEKVLVKLFQKFQLL